jgi:hypothetical protein
MKYVSVGKKTMLYRACKLTLALPKSYDPKVAGYLVNHLVTLIFFWVKHCGTYNPNVPFQRQQNHLVHFLSTLPLPPYTIQSFRLFTICPFSMLKPNRIQNRFHQNYKLFQRKQQAQQRKPTETRPTILSVEPEDNKYFHYSNVNEYVHYFNANDNLHLHNSLLCQWSVKHIV